jgi:hypothetical protein
MLFGWSEGSQSRQTAEHSRESRGTRNEKSLCWRGPEAIYQSVSLFHRLKSVSMAKNRPRQILPQPFQDIIASFHAADKQQLSKP